MKRILKTIAPWALCAFIFYFLFKQFGGNGDLRPEDIWHTLMSAHAVWLFVGGFFYFLTIMAVDCFSLTHILERFVTPIGFWETVRVRGVSYLLMIFNYGAGQGGFAVYLRKTRGAKLSKTLGAMLFITANDVILTLTAGFIAVLMAGTVNIGGVELRPAALRIMPLVYVGFIAWVLFWRHLDSSVVRSLTRLGIVQRLLAHDVFHIFREAKPSDYAKIFLWRSPLLVFVILGYVVALVSFDAWIPLGKIFLYNPIILFAGALPITPSGLGTAQYLAVLFYRDLLTSPFIDAGVLTPEKILLASSLAWLLLNQLYKALFGALCLNLTSKDLFQETPATPSPV